MPPLTQNTKTTLGVVCTCAATALTCTWWLSAKFGTIEQAISESYTKSMASENALRLAIENPGIRVPDPRNPGQVIVVQKVVP